MNPAIDQKRTKKELESVFKTSIIVFLFLFGAKLLNFVKKILIGQLFGVSTVADAFFAASYLPYYVTIFFEGILFLGFLPLFSQVMAEKGREEANQFVGEVLILFCLLTTALAALAWWGAPWIIPQLVPGFSSAGQDLTRSLFQILSLVIIFISVTSFFKALNSFFEDYAAAASSGLMDTVVTIGVTLLAWKFWGIYGAAWGSVVGALTALIFQATYLFKKRKIFPKRLTLHSVWLKQLFYFLFPMGIIWTLQQLPMVILNRFGSGMWEGTISALSISQTMTTVPMGLVSHTVLFAIFPSLAKQAHSATPEDLKETFFQTLRGGYLILLPVGFLLSALARPLTALFFAGGGISYEGSRRIANSLICFGWATFALYADLFMTQSLIAIRKTVPAICLCATRAILTYVFCLFLSPLWDYQGIAFSYALALAVNFFVLFPLVFQMSPIRQGWTTLFVYCFRLILASSPVLFMGWLVNQWPLTAWIKFSKPIVVLDIGLGFLGSVSCYLFVLYKLKIREIRFIFRGFREGWVRRNWWFTEQSQ